MGIWRLRTPGQVIPVSAPSQVGPVTLSPGMRAWLNAIWKTPQSRRVLTHMSCQDK